MNSFFSNFPIITYNGVKTIDITKNISMVANVVSNNQILTSFVLNEPMRSDQLARQQYNDPSMEWLVWMTNGKTNPYDWYMTQNQLVDYVDKKYGDYTLCQQKIKYYINNWYNGNNLDSAGYESITEMHPELIKYYEPVYNNLENISHYIRRQVDWIIATNHIVQFNITNTVVIPSFIDNEIVTVNYSPGVTASGQVCYSGMRGINIQHVSGDYTIGATNATDNSIIYSGTINPTTFSIVGSESGSILTITNINQISISIYDTLMQSEYIYYDPVTIFDDENIRNEGNKYMYYLPEQYQSQALSELGAALNG